ncbi:MULTISPECIES: hypothetical protein [unclassified Novosphingobium]|uniref:hypothetical protein n=1 Tax=Novosphingobium TaxID=165696 RepID=UPI001446517B|nr:MULTISPECIES: hypothetical protein [unclassified Novosphingobium]NKJ42621.1 hypothetical protein [Novosphingobium sp. SG720]NMN05737.1 hypothetical protein [Novosphingobium sp. SG919]NMN87903.1 hypothetical protein [Novosphingobium sp. SG916]
MKRFESCTQNLLSIATKNLAQGSIDPGFRGTLHRPALMPGMLWKAGIVAPGSPPGRLPPEGTEQ